MVVASTAHEELRGVAFDESHPRGILGDPLTTPLAALAYLFNESESERHDRWGSRAKGALDFDGAGRAVGATILLSWIARRSVLSLLRFFGFDARVSHRAASGFRAEHGVARRGFAARKWRSWPGWG